MPENDHSDSAKNAYLANVEAFKQVRMLWDDEIECCCSLVEKRQHMLTALAFIVGASMVFVGIVSSKNSPPPSLFTIICIGFSSLTMLVALNLTLTSSEFWIPAMKALSSEVWPPRPKGIFHGINKVRRIRRRNGVRVSREIIVDEDELKIWLIIDEPAEISNARTTRLFAAYGKMIERNETLKTRIKSAQFWFLRSVMIGLVGFWGYIYTVYQQPGGSTNDYGTGNRLPTHGEESAKELSGSPRTSQSAISPNHGGDTQTRGAP